MQLWRKGHRTWKRNNGPSSKDPKPYTILSPKPEALRPKPQTPTTLNRPLSQELVIGGLILVSVMVLGLQLQYQGYLSLRGIHSLRLGVQR